MAAAQHPGGPAPGPAHELAPRVPGHQLHRRLGQQLRGGRGPVLVRRQRHAQRLQRRRAQRGVPVVGGLGRRAARQSGLLLRLRVSLWGAGISLIIVAVVSLGRRRMDSIIQLCEQREGFGIGPRLVGGIIRVAGDLESLESHGDFS